MNKTARKEGKHIEHPLNLSRSKSAYSFRKQKRFILQPNYSPNKFYDPSSTLSCRKTSIGFGNKTNFQKPDFVQPTRYKVVSQFDKASNSKCKASTFGINRQVDFSLIQQYYKGKQYKNQVGPGAYNINSPIQFTQRSNYIGTKAEPKLTNNNVSLARQEIINKLGIYQNAQKRSEINGDYYPKHLLKQKGKLNAGSSINTLQGKSHKESKSSIFSREERIKPDKMSRVGPGSYNRFSEFDLI